MFRKDYINDGLRNYLRISVSSEADMNMYQLNLLKANRFNFILPVEVKIDTDYMSMDYCIDHMMSLKMRVELKGALSKYDFIKMMQDICDILLNRKQQLTSDYFLLSKEFIYFNKDTMETKLIFAPIKDFKGKLSDSLSQFIKEMVPRLVKYEDAIGFYKELLDESEKDTFNVSKCLEILNYYDSLETKNNSGNSTHQNGIGFVKSSIDVNIPPQPQYGNLPPQPQHGNIPPQQLLGNLTPQPPKGNLTPQQQYGNVNNKQNKKAKEVKQVVKNSEQRKKRILASVLLQIIFLIIIGGIVNYFIDEIAKAAVLSLLVILVDALLVYKIVGPAKVEDNAYVNTNANVNANIAATKQQPELFQQSPKAKEIKKGYVYEPVKDDSQNNKTAFFVPPTDFNSDNNMTQMIVATPKLEGLKNRETILLNIKPNQKWILGRGDQTNVKIVDGTISREHAVIHFDGMKYFIEDLNSLNGTRVNGERIVCNKLVPLEHNQVLQIGEIEYRFISS